MRELEGRVQQSRAHALARLAHRRIRQPHDGEHGQPGADVDLDRDLSAVDPLEGEGGDACEHTATLSGAGNALENR